MHDVHRLEALDTIGRHISVNGIADGVVKAVTIKKDGLPYLTVGDGNAEVCYEDYLESIKK